MRNSLWILVLLIFLSCIQACSPSVVLTFGFYNVENLFDTIDDPETADEQFLPTAEYQWDTKKYNNKIGHLSEVISKMVDGKSPDFLGLCEVENKRVIEDLIAHKNLKKTKYKIVHHESKDTRGIDVAAIYNSDVFTFVDGGTRRINLYNHDDVTRDILWVRLKPKKGEDVYFVVNHWPSRRGGMEKSEPKRIKAAETLLTLCNDLLDADSSAQIVIMGDFNDMPDNKSIEEVLGAKTNIKPSSNSQLFNAMGHLVAQGRGSYCYRGDWNMLDQLILNGNFFDGKSWEYVDTSSQILDPQWLRQHHEIYEGYPLRTFGGSTYLNGYSDHFPVYGILRYTLR